MCKLTIMHYVTEVINCVVITNLYEINILQSPKNLKMQLLEITFKKYCLLIRISMSNRKDISVYLIKCQFKT